MREPWEVDLSVYGDEAALLEGLRRREHLACTCLLKGYAPRLYRLASQLTDDPDEAGDVLQESFIRACAQVEGIEGRSSLGTWLHRAVLNTALMHLRRRRAGAATAPRWRWSGCRTPRGSRRAKPRQPSCARRWTARCWRCRIRCARRSCCGRSRGWIPGPPRPCGASARPR